MSELAADRYQLRPALVPEDLETIRTLFVEYARSLGFSLCFQGFDQELKALPGAYARPRGELLLGSVAGAVAGVVGLRPLDDGRCEMKRLYVRPAARGLGLGRALAVAILAAGRERGYRAMRLDTIETMAAARDLYGKLGFRPIAPYNDSPLPTILHFECPLVDGF